MTPSPDRPDGTAATVARREQLVGHDLVEAVGRYEALHNALRVELTQARDREFGYRLRTVGEERFVLRSSALSARRWGRIEPIGRTLVTWSQGGPVVFDAGTADERVVPPGTPALYPDGRPFTLDTGADVVLHTVDVDRTLLEHLQAVRPGGAGRPLRLVAEPDAAALDAFRGQLTVSAPLLLDPDADARTRTRLVDAVSRSLLDAFAPLPRREDDGHPDNVSRALDHIDAYLAYPMTTTDIAAAAGLSERGLQQAFARSGLPTPTEALRDARLLRAREVLRDASPATASVATVARALGFGHSGRFAGYYAERFGERPSDTLRH